MAWYDYITGAQGYHDAKKELEDKWRQAQQFQTPYNEAGQGQIGRLNEAENKLLDPSALLNDWITKYQVSPYAKTTMENAKNAGLDTASSMGLLGSSTALNNIQQSSADIMNADRQQYLDDLMKKYMSGIGIGQNMYNTGAATAGNMGRQAVRMGENTADMAYGEANSQTNFIKNLLAKASKIGLMP